MIQTHNVRGAAMNSGSLDMVLEESVLLLMRNSDVADRFLPTVIVNDNLRAPIREGDVVGRAIYTVNGVEYSFNLVAGHDVASSNLIFYLLRGHNYILHNTTLER